MNITAYSWPDGVRPCRFSLCFNDGSVFADFDVDGRQCVYLVRISFDGYGCCTVPKATQMSPSESSKLLHAWAANDVNHAWVRDLLHTYLSANKHLIWEDALVEYGLIRPSQ